MPILGCYKIAEKRLSRPNCSNLKSGIEGEHRCIEYSLGYYC
jgi:hypothetical protein